MRRKDREITDEARLLEILDGCDILRLGLADGDYPYLVPVNFAWEKKDGTLCLYIHGAMAGRKFELLTRNPHCSFEADLPLRMECLYEEHDITMRYRSVMGKAEASLLDGEEKRRAVEEVILARYPETREFPYNRSALPRTAVFRLTVTELTGKENPLKGGADL